MVWLLAAVGVALVASCTEIDTDPPLYDGFHYPVGLAVTPSGDHLLVANSNYDLGMLHGTVVVVDLESREFVPKAGISVGSFSGGLVMGPAEDDGRPRAGYLPVREDDSLTWFDMNWSDGSPGLSCNDPTHSYSNRRCAGRYVVTKGTDYEDDSVNVGNDPFSGVVLPGRIGEPDYLIIGSLRTGSLDLFTLDPDDGAPTLVDQLVVTQGLNDLALHAASRTVFVSAKYAAVVLRIKVALDDDGPRLYSESALSLPLSTSSSDIGRSLAFTSDGSRLLVAWRAPDGLMVFDTSSEGSPEPDVSLLGIVSVGDDPALVRIYPSGPDGSERAYVVSLSNNSVYVVNPETLVVETRIRVGPSNDSPDLSGISPFAMTWSPQRKEAYVANFLGHTVSILDLDVTKDTYHTVIEEIR